MTSEKNPVFSASPAAGHTGQARPAGRHLSVIRISPSGGPAPFAADGGGHAAHAHTAVRAVPYSRHKRSVLPPCPPAQTAACAARPPAVTYRVYGTPWTPDT